MKFFKHGLLIILGVLFMLISVSVVGANADIAHAPQNVVLTHSVTATIIKDDPNDAANDRRAGSYTFPAGDHVTIDGQYDNGVTVAISDASHPNKPYNIQYTYPLNMSDAQIEATFSHGGNSQSTNQNKNKLVQTGEQHRGALITSVVVIVLLMGVGARMISLHFKHQRNY